MEQLNVSLENDPGKDLVIRTGEALEVYPKTGYRFEGQIESPVNYLLNKKPDPAETVVEVSEASITAIVGYNLPPEQQDYIRGQIKQSRFINEIFGGLKQPVVLGEYLRKNRMLFPEIGEGLKAVSSLKSFSAKVHTQISKTEDKGAATWEDVLNKKIQTDLPRFIKLRIPMLEGQDPRQAQVFDCEVFVTQQNREIYVELESLDFAEAFEYYLEEAIAEALNQVPGQYLILYRNKN